MIVNPSGCAAFEGCQQWAHGRQCWVLLTVMYNPVVRAKTVGVVSFVDIPHIIAEQFL